MTLLEHCCHVLRRSRRILRGAPELRRFCHRIAVRAASNRRRFRPAAQAQTNLGRQNSPPRQLEPMHWETLRPQPRQPQGNSPSKQGQAQPRIRVPLRPNRLLPSRRVPVGSRKLALRDRVARTFATAVLRGQRANRAETHPTARRSADRDRAQSGGTAHALPRTPNIPEGRAPSAR